MNEGLRFTVRDEFGQALAEMLIPWEELWFLKRTLLCTVSYGEIIIW